ncbi:aspartate aminotransferase family protein [Nostoc calcicola FACHB-3891]|nr:aspartate aminotransferase family protein [Nostoc calcicola FACHB-3891]
MSTNKYPLWLGYMDMPSFLDNPITIVDSYGCTVIDSQGIEYIDLSSGIRNVILGYSEERIVKAVTEQMKKVTFVKGSSFGNEPALELAQEIQSIANISNPRMLFHNSGTEAVEASIKLIRQYSYLNNTNRNTIATLKNGYHGQTIGALSASGEEYSKEPFKPYLNGFTFFDLPQNDGDIDKLEFILKKDNTIGAIMLEPILGNGGVVEISEKYLKAIKNLCLKYNILLICDEVTTGFGRCGEWFLTNQLEPEIIIGGKVLANGYLPLSVVIVSEKIWKVFDEKGSFRHGQTNLNHPVCCACGLETLKILKEIDAPKLSLQKGEMIQTALQSLFDKRLVTSVRGKGLLWAIEFDSNIHKNHKTHKWLEKALLDKHFIVGQIDNIIFIAPPLIVNIEHINNFINMLGKCLEYE